MNIHLFDTQKRSQALATRTAPLAGSVVYWMSRDQRAHDNWALWYAAERARQAHIPLRVVFNFVPSFLGATDRQYDFMIRGLQEVEKALHEKGIFFDILFGDPITTIPDYCKRYNTTLCVVDFSPLKIGRTWRTKVAEALGLIQCECIEIDAHNSVPVWETSNKVEFAAYTIRPKIHKLLTFYVRDEVLIPPELPHFEHKHFLHEDSFHHAVHHDARTNGVDWTYVQKNIKLDTSVSAVDWCIPGEKAAHEALQRFVGHNGANGPLSQYAHKRNDPTYDGQSNLSPYIHFGQLSVARIIHEVIKASGQSIADLMHEHKNAARGGENSYAAFLEELIVRKELADNFCFYNPYYDTVEGFPEWAQKSHHAHAHDTREYIYTREQFEHAHTHDDLWNAAQMQMVRYGKMHGYMRMYWAKKILEWTESPEQAMEIAIYLNDRYELDGRDPSGYAGIAWSIGGVHDRAWFERSVFGQIRYMNRNGCAAKFDIKQYIEKYGVSHNKS